jgi:hypothetical protein
VCVHYSNSTVNKLVIYHTRYPSLSLQRDRMAVIPRSQKPAGLRAWPSWEL